MDFDGLPTEDIIDIVDNYSGNMYIVLKDKVYEVEYQDTTGKFELNYVDAQELTYKKRLNWMAVDADGAVNDIVKDGRSIYIFNKKLAERKPDNWITIGAQFSGILYNIELDTEIFPSRKV